MFEILFKILYVAGGLFGFLGFLAMAMYYTRDDKDILKKLNKN